ESAIGLATVHWDHEPHWEVQGAAAGGALQNLADVRGPITNAPASWTAAVLRCFPIGEWNWNSFGSWRAPSALRPCIGTMNLKRVSPSESRRAFSGSWKAPTTSMPCIGTMNPSGSCHRYGVPPSGGPDRLKPGLQTGASWEGV